MTALEKPGFWKKISEWENRTSLFIAIYHSLFSICLLSDVQDNLLKFFLNGSKRKCCDMESVLRTMPI